MTRTYDLRPYLTDLRPEGDGMHCRIALPVECYNAGDYILLSDPPHGIRYQIVEIIDRPPSGPIGRVRFAPRTMAAIQTASRVFVCSRGVGQ